MPEQATASISASPSWSDRVLACPYLPIYALSGALHELKAHNWQLLPHLISSQYCHATATIPIKQSARQSHCEINHKAINLRLPFQNDYTYFSWSTDNGWGRLKQIKSGTTGTPDLLQDLQYFNTSTGASEYDGNGNIWNIYDLKAGGKQTQAFTYDSLDRLTSAYASGGTGGTYGSAANPENYLYNGSTGNLSEVEGRVYTYDTTKVHAVRRVSGSGGGNATISVRAYSTACQDGVRATMELWINDSKVQTWTNVASAWTTYNKTTPLSGNDKIDVVFTNDCSSGGYDRNLYIDYVIVNGTTIQAEGGAAIIDSGSGTAAFDGNIVVVGQQSLYGNSALRLVKGVGSYASGYDANGNMTSRVVDGAGWILSYDAENRLTQAQSSTTTATFVYDGDGNHVKATVGGVTTTYIGSHFEWTGSTSTMIKYYYAGATRVAMRVGSNTPKWLLSDHLGSQAITVSTNGLTEEGELRYKAWGETRYSSGTTPTKRQYTGQISETSLGIYYYGARWYDGYLNRWTSPDSIIPLESQGVQAWDRYAFVNNNPVRFNDPLGHCIGPLAIVCVALIEAAPAIIEAVAYAVTAYVIADQISSNPPTVNGEQVNIGIIIPPGPGLIPEIPAISNPVPDRLARVIPAKYANTAETLGPPGVDDVFVTAADDIAGITSSQELAKRLALLDNSGNPLQGPLAILEFDTPSEGIASPILRNNPGFVGGGRTASGAREFVIPNSRLEDLENLFIRSVK